jgi:N-methylhydantoinase A
MNRPSLLSFDMGGTTAKACLIEHGRPGMTSEFEVGRLQRFKKGSGLPIKISSVELIETGAGGGSIARVDRFGLLKVGPDSAGSEPGPACYQRGGVEPTVTDADLVLGYIDPTYFLGGRMRLDPAAAERAIRDRLADPLGLSVARAAWSVHQVVNENMANAARVHAAERGRDPRNFPLFAFGGAGPVHAYRVAEKLGIKEIIAPFGAGVGSTIGLLVAPIAFDFVRTAAARVRSLDWDVVGQLLTDMEQDGRALLGRAGVAEHDIVLERAADMRLIGQTHEITVPLPGDAPVAGDEERLERAFEHTYSGLFGRTPPDVPMEVVSWRVRLSAPSPVLTLGGAMDDSAAPANASSQPGLKGERPVYSPDSDSYEPTPVYDRYRLAPGTWLGGPAVIEERESTVVIGPHARAHVDDLLNLIVELS